MSGQIAVERLKRTTLDDKVEELQFTAGVNVIVGAQNTGKSTWLRMLDYIMGDTGSPTTKFDASLVQKYKSIAASFRVGDASFELERSWAEDGSRSRASLDGAPISIAEIQPLLLERLAIPSLRYPQGNVLASDRAWPTLGWRSLLRHIYRRQDSWGELVSQQPESEQQACLLQFLGIAEHLFSEEHGVLVDKQKRIARLESRKEYFVEIMNQIAPGIVGDQGISVGITLESIEAAARRLKAEIDTLIETRTTLLQAVRDKSAPPGGEVAKLMEDRTAKLHQRTALQADLALLGDRSRELAEYERGLRQELERLARVDTAAAIFEEIKITNCPACDQSVQGRPHHHSHCFLCGQATAAGEQTADAAERRLKFERDRLGAEIEEAMDLVKSVSEERSRLESELVDLDRFIRGLEDKLRPFQSSVSAVVPEEIALIDQKIGSLGAQAESLQRLREPLETRDKLSAEIDALQAEIRRHEANLSAREEKIELEAASDRMSESFNTYLNALRNLDQNSWTKSGAVSVRVSERRTQYLIGRRPYKEQLGGTLTLFFLFAYQYALLALTKYPECHYPGLAILDLFPDIAKGDALRDRIGLVLEPFVELSRQSGTLPPIQIIATSRDFAHRDDINILTLQHIWR